jgi:hypothetical protein
MDGAISEREHSQVRAHLESCAACRRDLESYRRMAVQLAHLERVAPPVDLAVRIRVRASRAASDPGWVRRAWNRSALVFKNILEPLAVPATGGILTAVMVFVTIVQSMLGGMPFGVIHDDLPTALIQPARLERLAPFPVPGIGGDNQLSDSDNLVLEATLNAQGQVVGYRILAGPGTAEVRKQIDQVLLFSRFRPMLDFGRPMSGGRVVLSFSEIRVRG